MYGGVPLLLILLCGILTAAGRILTDADRDMHNLLFCISEMPDKGKDALLILPLKCEPYFDKIVVSSIEKDKKEKKNYRPWEWESDNDRKARGPDATKALKATKAP